MKRDRPTDRLAERVKSPPRSDRVKQEESFRGRSEVKIDEKGRLSLPSLFRTPLRLTPTLVITNFRIQGRNALHIYTMAEWQKIETQIDRLPALDPAVQAFIRFYISGGQVVDIDRQGRILLPIGLRKFAGLGNQAVLVGLGDRLELWSEEVWQTLFVEMTAQFDQIQNRVSDLLSESEALAARTQKGTR